MMLGVFEGLIVAAICAGVITIAQRYQVRFIRSKRGMGLILRRCQS